MNNYAKHLQSFSSRNVDHLKLFGNQGLKPSLQIITVHRTAVLDCTTLFLLLFLRWFIVRTTVCAAAATAGGTGIGIEL